MGSFKEAHVVLQAEMRIFQPAPRSIFLNAKIRKSERNQSKLYTGVF